MQTIVITMQSIRHVYLVRSTLFTCLKEIIRLYNIISLLGLILLSINLAYNIGLTYIRVKKPYFAYTYLMQLFIILISEVQYKQSWFMILRKYFQHVQWIANNDLPNVMSFDEKTIESKTMGVGLLLIKCLSSMLFIYFHLLIILSTCMVNIVI